MVELPAEILAQIFNEAADEDVIFQYGLPTAMAESAWTKNLFNKWMLRHPAEALNVVQRRSYTTKKAIISTCKAWRHIGSELLFRCLYFSEPAKLLSLCAALDSSSSTASTISSSLGWWTRRIHLARYNRNVTMQYLEDALTSVIRHCPNLEIFVVDVPMKDIFGPAADTLANYAFKHLKTVHWTVDCQALPKVIWALDSLPTVVCAHIDFETDGSEDAENIRLGSASGLRLSLRYLQQLSLQGYFGQFLEQAAGWSLPSLRVFSFDCGNHRNDQPDVVGFLAVHGSKLIFLDLNCIPSLDVPKILDLCPMLTTFCFNADWRLQPPGEEARAPPTMHGMANQSMSVLVNNPHHNITTIGLHGLMYAFGVGYAAEYSSSDPVRGLIIQRSNDLNVAALNKVNFPKLQRVRALSRPMLNDLNDANGPSEEYGGVERYDNWWNMLMGNGIRLEDCTGVFLGTLPDDDEEEGEEDADDEEEDEWDSDLPPIDSDEEEPTRKSSNIDELRQLLAECRAMAAEREEPMFPPMFGGMMGMPMGPPTGPPMNMGMGMGTATGMGMMGMAGGSFQDSSF